MLVKYVSHWVKIGRKMFSPDSPALMLDVLKSNIKILAEVQKNEKWKDNEYLWYTKALKMHHIKIKSTIFGMLSVIKV